MISIVYFLVSCPALDSPNNGLTNCSLGDDEVPSYEDICSFLCNDGYELTGSETRTCESDGSWSGDSAICNKSKWLLMCMHFNYALTYVIGMKHYMLHTYCIIM